MQSTSDILIASVKNPDSSNIVNFPHMISMCVLNCVFNCAFPVTFKASARTLSGTVMTGYSTEVKSLSRTESIRTSLSSLP